MTGQLTQESMRYIPPKWLSTEFYSTDPQTQEKVLYKPKVIVVVALVALVILAGLFALSCFFTTLGLSFTISCLIGFIGIPVAIFFLFLSGAAIRGIFEYGQREGLLMQRQRKLEERKEIEEKIKCVQDPNQDPNIETIDDLNTRLLKCNQRLKEIETDLEKKRCQTWP